jgi:Na+-translocating ferredoxin:NAD+ oxidoreductase subunit D
MTKLEEQTTLYTVSPSPHAHSGASVSRIMLDVIVALCPALLAAVYYFGWDALRLVVVCVVAAVGTEALCRAAMGRPVQAALSDLSAVVTGLLLAFNLPPSLSSGVAALGSVFAVGIGKQVFGGLGYNPFNPALIGRAFLLISFTGRMTAWHAARLPARWQWGGLSMDAQTGATPLGMVKESLKAGEALPITMDGTTTLRFLIGDMGGCIGEVSALALLLGGLYLLYRRCITWHVPVCYLGTVAVYSAVQWGLSPDVAMPPHFHLLTGGLMLGAWFMATDMVTTPITPRGLAIFGVGCGVLTMLLRTVTGGVYPEGVSFAILLMNAVTPLIDRATRPRIFGERKPS